MDGAFGTPRALAGDPVETPAPFDPIESMADAAVRLGMSVHTMRERARRIGLPLPSRGRPELGTVKGLRQSEWDRCLHARGRLGRFPRQYDDARPEAPWDVAEDRILWRYTVGRDPCKAGIDWDRILRLLPRRNREVAGRRLTVLRAAGIRPLFPRDHDLVVQRYAMMQCDAATLRLLRLRPQYVDRYASFYRIGPPAGRLTLPAAAEMTGFSRLTLLTILARQGVEVLATRRLSDGHLLYTHVDEAACTAAVLRDMAMETTVQASVRHQIPRSTLRQWMADAGHAPPGRPDCVRRHAPEVFDAVIAAKREAEDRKVTAVARRVGVAPCTLRDWLRHEGVESKRPVPPEVMERVLKAHAASVAGTRKEPR